MRDAHLYPPISPRGILLLFVAAIPVLIASTMGSALTAPALVGWYPALKKPFFTPPNIVFPLVWTFLYALMVLAFWRILRARPETGPRWQAIMVFLAQLVLNIGWSWAFFGRQSPILGLAVIGALLIAVVLTIRLFQRIDRPAGWSLYPYLAWVCFAGLLNGAIAVMNP